MTTTLGECECCGAKTLLLNGMCGDCHKNQEQKAEGAPKSWGGALLRVAQGGDS
jgi:predicted amidophosphoribosyltransferase